jgi:hypothetical protein
LNFLRITHIMAAAKVGVQPKALLKLPKEIPSNIVGNI